MVPNGYNLRNGGNSGRQHEETKNKISKTIQCEICCKYFARKSTMIIHQEGSKCGNIIKEKPLQITEKDLQILINDKAIELIKKACQ